jgi:hypothetical protein
MTLTSLPEHAAAARVKAEQLLAARLATTAGLDGDRRCAEPTGNLVRTITEIQWQTIAAQLGGGNGGELQAIKNHRPKFCSAFSSCALAVNAFGPFVDGATTLQLLNIGIYSGPLQFEAQRTAGTRGYKPNLDVVAEPANSDWLYFESKCLEYLRPHTTDFSDAFVIKANKLLSSETATVYERFSADHDGYVLLDVAQLLKHFLAAKLAADHRRAVTLAYVFWEPADADQHPVFAAHRAEAERLATSLVDEEVRLVPLSYPSLWAGWEALDDPILNGHVAGLRERYGVSLGS